MQDHVHPLIIYPLKLVNDLSKISTESLSHNVLKKKQKQSIRTIFVWQKHSLFILSVSHPWTKTTAWLKTMARSCHSLPPHPRPSSPFAFLLPLKSQARKTSQLKHTLTTALSHMRTHKQHKHTCAGQDALKMHTHTHERTLCGWWGPPQFAAVNGVEQVSSAAI